MNLEEISEKLFSQKIIQNPNLFKIWVKISFSEKKLRYGQAVCCPSILLVFDISMQGEFEVKMIDERLTLTFGDDVINLQ